MATQCYIFVDGEWKEVISVNIYNENDESWKEAIEYYIVSDGEFR